MTYPVNPGLPDTIAAPGPITRNLGRYVLEHSLGAGRMGEVFRARDTLLERTVAIKMLPRQASGQPAGDSSLRHRFLREARAASALNHPNIVALYDICTDRDGDFLVMEFVDGQTLKQLIAQESLTLNHLAELGAQIALALSAAHAAGVVHRDIKPANIMVTKSQEAKVLDFGIARITRNSAETQLTGEGQVLGTAAYMSPEQTRGDDTDFRSDLFSLGSVLYEASTGRPPFQAASILGLMHQIATIDPEPPSVFRPELQPEFVRLVMRCLAKDRAHRLESAAELATELKTLTFPVRTAVKVQPRRTTVAVVPLRVRGPVNDQYLSVSLAEALIHRLSASGTLLLRPISSVIRYAGEENDWAKVARELNVDVVVEGTAQIAGSKIRVLVQVHRATDDHTLASLKQDGDSSDLFGLQDRLTEIVSAVFDPKTPEDGSQSGAPPRLSVTAPPTRNPAAFELYLRAVDRQVHVDKFEMASAIELLTRATELDPAFADAWGLLAQACAQMGAHLDPDPKWFEIGERAIARTLELDPVQCTALCARSMIAWSPSRGFQNRAALRALNAAIKIDPARPTAHHQRSALLWHLGFPDAAERDALELQLTHPALALLHLGSVYLTRGDFDQGADFYARALELEPNAILNHLMSPVAILYAGNMDQARRAIENGRRMYPMESFGLGMEAILAGIDGDARRAEILADEATRSTHSMTHTHHTWHSCAAAYALSGRPEKAIHELGRCAAMGLPNYRMFQVDPYLRSLHDNPDFLGLMSTLRREHDSLRDEFGLEP